MIIDDSLLRRDEKAAFALRALFEKHGYSRFFMGRFEEYDLYAGNKDFLADDRMISFTDIDGTLMALKPDVTLSVIRHTSDLPGQLRKVYYNENVYRAGRGDSGFREIMQAGLECIGEVKDEDICQTVLMAVESLNVLGGRCVLNISNLSFVTDVFAAAELRPESYGHALRFVREKNAPAIRDFCRSENISSAGRELLERLISVHGPLGTTLEGIRGMCPDSPALARLESVNEYLARLGRADGVLLDFSIVNNMAYYDGMVFQGYMEGIPESVLSGGQYDALARKMGKKAGAIGFAVYLNKLEYLDK
ncbi:MAG: ATP phosphoribosyltransferase regulatory subunit [Oscillospiraceae bacterium]|jgi:ATP phosphoribosyltransferase regulatory subunit|nr:ATP phosphoribosyltransferase regulatory subunit [Oscillospiraceae bacterium]